ncbi:MAG: hypothetical protein B6240_14680 [Desulfobacteraceae bacterium 4572_87]|nr:MAG: hypothetical protein B6240_14680 [Desulfobacteraceae bacterium 4572_87]
MPQPNIKESIIAGPLAGVSVQYRNKDYIADRVFPIMDGVDPKVKITKYEKGAWFRDEAAIRSAGTRAKRGGYPLSTVSVSTSEYAFAKEVTDEDRRFATAQGAPVVQPVQDAIEFCADKIDLKKEIRVAATIKGTTWADGNSGGEDAAGLWAASSGNTFLADITKGRKKIQDTTGLDPNCLLVDYATYLSLIELADLTDKIKYTQKAVFGAELLASMLTLDSVLVGKAIYSSAQETKAGTDFTAAKMWEVNAGKGMGFLFHRAPRLGLKVATAGMQIRIAYENGAARRTSTWREAAEHQDVYECAEETEIAVIGSDLGYLWQDTYAT